MSAHDMPPLPVLLQRADQFYGTENVGDAVRAYARTYAAEQVRELVEALEAIADPTVRVDGRFAGLAVDRFRAIASALIAKHKGQA